MSAKILKFLLFTYLLTYFTCQKYELYQFYEINAFSPHERKFLNKLHIREPSLIFLNGVTNDASIPIQVIVEPQYNKEFQQHLEEIGAEYTIFPNYMSK